MAQKIITAPGRVRLRVTAEKCRFGCRQCLYDLLHGREGVMEYEINESARSVMVRYDDQQVSRNEILRLLSSDGYCAPQLIETLDREDDSLQDTLKEVVVTVGQAAVGTAIKTGLTPAFAPAFVTSLAQSIAVQTAKRSVAAALS